DAFQAFVDRWNRRHCGVDFIRLQRRPTLPRNGVRAALHALVRARPHTGQDSLRLHDLYIFTAIDFRFPLGSGPVGSGGQPLPWRDAFSLSSDRGLDVSRAAVGKVSDVAFRRGFLFLAWPFLLAAWSGLHTGSLSR